MESANSAQTSPRLIFVYLVMLLELNTVFQHACIRVIFHYPQAIDHINERFPINP
ncbi:MAG: hypothetical protein RLZZ215_434 [Pseudomonadota bacterium]|jgi:hypothetical protein